MKVSKICQDCNHLDKHTNIEGVSPVCGVHLGLAHWHDAKGAPYWEGDECQYKGTTYIEAMKLYWGKWYRGK